MPQLAIHPDYVASVLSVRVQTNVNDPGGNITAIIENERGLAIARHGLSWRSERDLTGLPRVLSDVADLYLWGEPRLIDICLPTAFRRHMPVVPHQRRR